ncbi:MAG: hypothetical protein IKF77_02245 [Thermoguttaceae bacterium]|nr:hypothetical protein [Thermoguttaceae bacterium]
MRPKKTTSPMIFPALVIALFLGSGAVSSAQFTDGQTPPVPDSLLAAATDHSAADGEVAAGDKSSEDELRAAIDDIKNQLSSLEADLKKKQDKHDSSKRFSYKVGGTLIMDAMQLSQSDASRAVCGQIDNRTQVRDARVSIKGEGYNFLSYGVTFGINKEEVNFKEVIVTAKDLPLFGDLTVGHFWIDSNMGYTQAIYDTPVADFDCNTNTFGAGRKLGIGSNYYTADKQGHLLLGIFTGKGLDSKTACAESDSSILFNARATAVPIYRRCGDDYLDEVLHVGAAYYWTRLDPDGQMNLRLRPTGWNYSMPYLLGGKVTLDDYSVAEAEVAWQKGGFAVQAEGFLGCYDGLDNATGATLVSRLMLTPGAFHEYDKTIGCFEKVVVPEELRFVDFENCKYFEGYGAFEAVCQYSHTDLNNLADAGGDLVYGTYGELIAGLNWFWNSQTRWSFNWVHAMPHSAGGGTAEKQNRDSDTFISQVRIKF